MLYSEVRVRPFYRGNWQGDIFRWMHGNLYTSDPWDWFCPKSTSQVISSTSNWKLSSPQSNVEVGFYYVDYCVGQPFRLGLSKATFTLPTQSSHISLGIRPVFWYTSPQHPTTKSESLSELVSWYLMSINMSTKNLYIRFVTILAPSLAYSFNPQFSPIPLATLRDHHPAVGPFISRGPPRLLLQLPPTLRALNLCHHLGIPRSSTRKPVEKFDDAK